MYDDKLMRTPDRPTTSTLGAPKRFGDLRSFLPSEGLDLGDLNALKFNGDVLSRELNIMLHTIRNFRSRRSASEKAKVIRLQRIGIIVSGIGVALLFVEFGLGCTLVPRNCVPVIPIASTGNCIGLIILLFFALQKPRERWPIVALAFASILSVGCLLVLMSMMR
jgi:hypothetical protein